MADEVVIFDGAKAEQLKRRGMLHLAQRVAVRIAERQGTVTSDDVFAVLARNGLNPKELGNAAGSVFRGHEFRFTGSWRKSRRPTNHARSIRVWALRGSE